MADLLAQRRDPAGGENIGCHNREQLKPSRFDGEIEFRKGHFEQAETLYREALKMDSKNARAHFGLGKLAMGKVNNKAALQELTRAIELDPKEPLYHLYASEAWGIDKNYARTAKTAGRISATESG